ncbi:MAG: ParB/RepB/Spo0J family partition protein, partial [Chloroflexales bacterium]|nr:ParB/RepB/Spo0J family partition protein [Chloroflexales bacterium]
MGRRKGFFATETRPEDDLARERDLAALVQARRTVVQDIGVGRIQPNPFQARQAFTDLEELAQAIRAQGFTTRLRVRPHPERPNTFQLVYGERRLRAARLAGLDSVPCEIADHSDDDLVEIGLAENIQRRDLEPLDEARAFATFIEQRGYSVRRLAERIGKDKSYVEDRLALLRMPADVQGMVAQRADTLRSARESRANPDVFARDDAISARLDELVSRTVHAPRNLSDGLTDRMDEVLLHPRLGLPLFFLSMLLGNFTGTELGNEYPHLMRLAQVFMLAYMPLSFLYIRQTLRPRPLSWTDFLHFLPVLIYIVDYLPFFMLSAEEKRQVNEALMNSGKLYTFNEGWFAPAGFYIALRFAVFTGYWIAGYIVLKKSLSDKEKDITAE